MRTRSGRAKTRPDFFIAPNLQIGHTGDMTVKAILFDKDGTLIDFDATFAPATLKVLNTLAEGDEGQANALAKCVGFDLQTLSIDPQSVLVAGSLEAIAETLLKPLGGSMNLEGLTAQIDALYIQHSAATVSPFPYLSDVLNELGSMGLPLGVATNDSENGALQHLNRIGISDRFVFIAGCDSGYGAKPNPGMVTAFADSLSLPARQVMMVGDSIHDCEAGRAAGAISVGLANGEADGHELWSYADHVLPDIQTLPALVHHLNSGQ